MGIPSRARHYKQTHTHVPRDFESRLDKRGILSSWWITFASRHYSPSSPASLSLQDSHVIRLVLPTLFSQGEENRDQD